jgi:hypothetical protein
MSGVPTSIYRRGDGCFVSPPTQTLVRPKSRRKLGRKFRVTDGDQIIWHAVNVDAEVRFPTPEPFGQTTYCVLKGKFVASGLAQTSGVFPYSVSCKPAGKLRDRKAVGKLAKGNSPPIVIVW